MSPFERLGGEPALRVIIDDLVDRITDDAMIGFLFARVNKARLKQLEFEHAAQHLGASVAYTGRSLRDAHRRHPIMGGHFGRRRQILKQVFARHGVPQDIQDAWLAAEEALRDDVTTDQISQCNDVAAEERANKAREGESS